MRLRIISTILLLTTSSWAVASQNHDEITQQVSNFVMQSLPVDDESRIEIAVGHIDSRLRLTSCELPLEYSFVHRSQQTTRPIVNVECRDTRPWRIYVPVDVKKMQFVAVARHTLPRGHRIEQDDIQLVEKDVFHLHHAVFQDSEALVGKVLKRSLPAGNDFTTSMLTELNVVKRGQSVMILAEKGNLQVKMRGIVQQSGKKGDTVKVKNSNSKRVVDAEVIGADQVKVY